MNKILIERINYFSRKEKETGLTEEEIKERENLRKQYLKEFRQYMKKDILDNIYITDKDGKEIKLTKKKKEK